MIILNVTAIMRDADKERETYYTDIITTLIEDIKSFHNEEFGAMFEAIGADGSFMLDSATTRVINPGHDMECSWFILMEGLKRGDKEIIDFAEKIFLEAFERAMEMDDDAMMRAYCARSATLGNRVQVIALTGTYTGVAEGITDSGSLLVRADDDGALREVLAADVSVRGIMGYV